MLTLFTTIVSRSLFLTWIFIVPASVILAGYYDLWWWLVAGLVYSKIIALIGVQIGLHRYFAHRSFSTGKLRHIVLCAVSLLCGEGSPTQWSVIHRHHHKNSDTKYDIHSPKESLWNAVFLWPLRNLDWYTSRRLQKSHIQFNDKYIEFTHRYYGVIWCVLIVATALIDWKMTVFLLLFPAGFATINSNLITNVFCHMKFPGSYRTFDLPDNSINNKWLQVYQWGEGLHNNHHKFPHKYTQAFSPNEFDPAAWVIKKFFLVPDPNSKYKF